MRKLRMIILGILAVCMGSCTDLLDKEPISQLSVNNLFNTEEGADAAVVGCYSFLYKPGYYWQERWVFAFEGPIYQGTVVVRPIINGLPVKTVGAIGGSRPIRRFVLAM